MFTIHSFYDRNMDFEFDMAIFRHSQPSLFQWICPRGHSMVLWIQIRFRKTRSKLMRKIFKPVSVLVLSNRAYDKQPYIMGRVEFVRIYEIAW